MVHVDRAPLYLSLIWKAPLCDVTKGRARVSEHLPDRGALHPFQHLQAAPPPPDVRRLAKHGHPIKSWTAPFDAARKEGKPGRSRQCVASAVDWLGWRADKWGDICGGRLSVRLPVWIGISEGAAAKKRDVGATAACWGKRWGRGLGGSAFEQLIRMEELQTCSGRRPVSTSNGGAAENRQTGPSWLCYKWAINSNWICSRKHINQTKAFIHIGILKGNAISRHRGSCRAGEEGRGRCPIVLLAVFLSPPSANLSSWPLLHAGAYRQWHGWTNRRPRRG